MINPEPARFAMPLLSDVLSKAKDRPPGYVEEVLAAGVRQDDTHVLIPRPAYDALRAKYSGAPPAIVRSGGGVEAAGQRTGWDGSAVWKMLHTSVPSVDLIGKVTQVIPCGRCKGHWLGMLTRTPPPVAGPLAAWQRWTWERHAEVNAMLYKPGLSFEEAARRWGWR